MLDHLNDFNILSAEDCPKLSSLTTFEVGARPAYYARATY